MNSIPISAINTTNEKLHIVMFPWLAFGHMIPWLELAKHIARKGHQISFVSTPRNIDRLPNLPPYLTPHINFVKLPLPHFHKLPGNAEATIDVPYNKVKYLKLAYDNLQQPLKIFLQSSNPDWILYDFVPFWVSEISKDLEIPCAFFGIFTAACLGFVGPPSSLLGEQDPRVKPEDYTVSPKWVPFPSTVAYRKFEILNIFDSVEEDDGNVSDFYRFGKSIQGADIAILRSCPEFEPEWLQLLENIYKKPVFPAGQLRTTQNEKMENNELWIEIKQWLDKQAKGSVVYIGFGSEAKPSQDQLTELAQGLELSKIPFFWALRTRRGSFDNELIELPDGFEERTKDQGVVYTSWVPQLSILGHDSVGGILTHSGWSTVVEGLSFGRALILLTFLADQGLNAKLLEEKQIGYAIPRAEEDGWFDRNSVADSLRLVMVKEEGRIYRDKANEMKGLFGDKDVQDRCVDKLLSYLQNHNKKNVTI